MKSDWDSNATIRREQIESGTDLTFGQVFVPLFKNLVREINPSSILEVGTGTGHMSVALASNGLNIVAVEPSDGMADVARDVLKGTEVRLIHSTIENFVEQLTFDLLLSHMCLQTVTNTGSFLRGVKAHMHRDSQFVFSIPHPCFYNTYKPFFSPHEYNYFSEKESQVSFFISLDKQKMISNVPYVHRPLSAYFTAIRNAGLYVMDFQEVMPETEIQMMYGALWQFPRYCWFRTKAT